MLINTGGEEKITKLSKMGGGNRSMGLFEDLQNEKKRIVIAKLTGETVDFSKLRQIAREFNEENDAGLYVDGSDQELWSCVTAYFRNLL